MTKMIRLTVLLSLFAAGPALSGNAFITDYLEDPTQVSGLLQSGQRWERFSFSEEQPVFGDFSINPLGDGVEYKINAVNYNLFLGDNLKVPFQLHYGDLDSSESPEDSNEQQLLDPTQGVAIQFPFAWRYLGNGKGGLCSFPQLEGYCVVGFDTTLRGVQLSETNGADEVSRDFVFGASAALRASLLFPIFRDGVGGDDSGQAGHFALALGVRYMYHNTDNQDLLFGELTTPTGDPIEFDSEFAALSVESEFDIYKYFKLRLEYFSPLSNDDVLNDVFKASIVVSTQ